MMTTSRLKCFSNYLIHARNVKRLLYTSGIQRSSAYDPDGQMTVSVLNQERDAPLMIDSISEIGFRLNNGFFVIGPVVVFSNTVISWNIKDDRDIDENSLSIFTNMYPKLDILVVGVRDIKEQRKLNESLQKIMHKFKINVEILPTYRACTTFNFLNVEQRFVGAALIPPAHIKSNEDDRFKLSLDIRLKKNDDLLLGE